MNYEEEEEAVDDIFEMLLSMGAVELMSIDENGEPIYRITELCKEILPDLYYMHKHEVDEITFSLWQLGVVDVTIGEENDMVSFRKHNLDKFLELEDTLSDDQIQIVSILMDKNMRTSAKKFLE
jgi:hypothetical protein